MINIPYDQLIAMILEKKQISREELESRIKAKMNQLSGLISRVGAAHIVANELGIRLLDSMGGKLKIGKILAGMRDVETLGKVVQVFEPRAFEGKLGQGKVGSIVIADETGQIRVVLWNDMANLIDRIKTGDIVRVIGGQARQNSGQRELHLNAKSRLIINPPGESVAEVKAPEPPKRYQISELQGNEAMAEIKATIVQVFDLRFYEVCPKCMKRLQPKGEEWHCQAHGKVQPDYSYVLNMIADDGSGTIRVVCFGRSVEAISGMTREELLRVREEPGLFDETKNNLLGSIMLFRGRALRNEMFDRIEFIARQVSPVDVDREIEMLKERVEQESMANPSIPAQTTASTDTTKPTPTQPSTAPDTQTRAEAESKPQTTEQTTEESVSPIPDEQKEKPGADAEEIDDFDIDEELV